ncbi:MAG: hypothetical protein NTW07_00730 [candidate division Zixibacteria bacterium]|nr:hypothetical protein [candidate division Zixibacteria bacterium]
MIVTKVDNEFLKLAELEHTIRQCLQQAEEDANDCPYKLRNIGWG